MLAYIAVLVVYFYGAGTPPRVASVPTADQASCAAIVQAAKQKMLEDKSVRDAQGGCIAVAVPPPRDKV